MLTTLLLAAALGPAKPTVIGPRRPTTTRPTSRFVSHERGTPASRLRFRCAVDSPALRRCAATIRPRLDAGAHLLRVRAVDPAGRTSPLARVRVTVAPAPPIATSRSIPVGSQPVNVAYGAGSVWARTTPTGRSRASTRRATPSRRPS